MVAKHQDTHDIPKIISIFNHKGGVGKTVTTASLGWKLASSGKKVLLIDADPQCNLTGFLVNPGTSLISEALQENHHEAFDPLEAFYNQYPNCNIRHALRPVLDPQAGKPYDLLAAEVFQVTNRQQLLPERIDIPQHLQIPIPQTLYLLAGHPSFGLWETTFTMGCENATSLAGSTNFPGAFHQLFTRTMEHHGFDYILIDLSPSSSTINKLIVMSSRFLVIPCSPDYASLMSMQTLRTMLPEWALWMQQQCLRAKEAILPPPCHLPVFLGFTVQLFTVVEKGEPAAGFRVWIKRLTDAVHQHLIPTLHARGMALHPDSYPNNGLLAQIRNFQSAGTASSQAHVPVFALTRRVAKTITNSSHIMDTMVPAANDIFTQFQQSVDKFWPQLPQQQQQNLIKLQQSLRILAQLLNVSIPDNPTQIFELAEKLQALYIVKTE